MNTKQLLEFSKMNRQWFEANKHLTNEQMLAAGLIDKCDLNWINILRRKPKYEIPME